VKPLAARAFRASVAADRHALAVDLVRDLAPGAVATALVTAAGAGTPAGHPRLDAADPRAVTRTLSLAVIGELGIRGAYRREFAGLERWQLSSTWKRP
jgi:hypothetical protein